MSKDDSGLPVGTDNPEAAAGAPAPEKKLSFLAKARIGGLVLLAAVILIIVARNWDPISIDIVGKKISVPLSVLVILTFLIGNLVGFLLAYLRPWRKHD